MRLVLNDTARESGQGRTVNKQDLQRFLLTEFVSRVRLSVSVERKFNKLFNN